MESEILYGVEYGTLGKCIEVITYLENENGGWDTEVEVIKNGESIVRIKERDVFKVRESLSADSEFNQMILEGI
tara:strand:+ start:167 stop:388 length:222 start_codon:yes stop_codon:yes gene_type:complete